jgi:hypothetical protein
VGHRDQCRRWLQGSAVGVSGGACGAWRPQYHGRRRTGRPWQAPRWIQPHPRKKLGTKLGTKYKIAENINEIKYMFVVISRHPVRQRPRFSAGFRAVLFWFPQLFPPCEWIRRGWWGMPAILCSPCLNFTAPYQHSTGRQLTPWGWAGDPHNRHNAYNRCNRHAGDCLGDGCANVRAPFAPPE